MPEDGRDLLRAFDSFSAEDFCALVEREVAGHPDVAWAVVPFLKEWEERRLREALRGLAAMPVAKLVLATLVPREVDGYGWAQHAAVLVIDRERHVAWWADSVPKNHCVPKPIHVLTERVCGVVRWQHTAQQQLRHMVCCVWALDNLRRLLAGDAPHHPVGDGASERYILPRLRHYLGVLRRDAVAA